MPILNNNLRILNCNNNQILHLPILNNQLEELYCINNKLNILPLLQNNLEIVHCFLNPVYDIISNNSNNLYNDIYELKNKILILNNFKFIYYLLKYKTRLIKWYWKSQEQKIKNKYSPNNLLSLLNNNKLEDILETW